MAGLSGQTGSVGLAHRRASLRGHILGVQRRHLRRRVSQLFQFFQLELKKMGIENVELD